MCVNIVIGQNIYPIIYDDCDTEQFFLEGKEIFTKYDDEDLLSDLLKTIGKEEKNKIRGNIYFQVVVDENGYHCCMSIKNELNVVGRKIDFKLLMDSETSWEEPIREGEATTVCAMVKIEFNRKTIVIKRLGFNGKTGWVELTRFETKK